MQKRMLFASFTAAKKTISRTGLHHTCLEKHIGSVASCNSDVWMYNGASWWGQAFDHWTLGRVFVWYTWLYKGETFVFLLSFPLSLPFDWTLRCWVCVCCIVLLYFECCVVFCVKKIKKLIKKIYILYNVMFLYYYYFLCYLSYLKTPQNKIVYILYSKTYHWCLEFSCLKN